ncbi:MAG: helix-hairpin-helix domain-containing protein [Bacilli bacterium]|nr:helix-hairpin-helix domain-containing protein [Bacilli bacterium]
MYKIILIAVIVTIIGLFVMTKIDPSSNSNTINGESTTLVGDDLVQVGITGQVIHPGDYEVNPSLTLKSLIDMAGGVTDNADPKSYTPTLLIGSRSSFYISKKADIPETVVTEDIAKVNVNTASEEDLKEVGFNKAQAAAVIAYREANGDFQALEDIMLVSGIGEKTYLAVRDKICLM